MKVSAVSVVLLLVLTACQGNSKADTTGQNSDGFPAPNKELVYRAAENAIRETGFAPDRDQSSADKGVLVSRWNTQLAPFSGHGTREKVTIRIHDIPGRVNYFTVETNVLRETNMNLVDPANPIMAEWKTPTRLEDMENLISRRIEMHFLTGEVSDEFRYRHGLGGNRARIDSLDPNLPEEEKAEPGILGFPPP